MNKKPEPREIAGLLARLAVGGIFIYAGAVKALAPAEEFAYAIEGYKVVGPKLALLAAYVMPWLELYAGALLAAGVYTRFFAVFNGLLLAFFELLLAQAWIRKLPVTSCGCFGSSGGNSIQHELIQNAGLLLLTVAAYRYGWAYSADRAAGGADA